MPTIKLNNQNKQESVAIIEPRKEHEIKRKIEKLKQKLTLLKAGLFNKGIRPNDTRTLQVHRDGQGNLRDYYIVNAFLQNKISYSAVTTILEDQEKMRYVYRGLVGGADNAIGVIESNVPISEIVASPSGNIKLQEMLSKDNAMEACKQYWRKIGESEEPLKGHSLYFGKPDFILGTILKEKNGRFTFTSEIKEDIDGLLKQEREKLKREEEMRVKEAVEIDLGGGMVVSQQDCWMEPGKNIKFSGINQEALFYTYVPDKPIKTEDGKYVYIGTAQIGKSSLEKQTGNMPIQFVSPFIYNDVVMWTENKTLIQYFMENKFKGLNFSLGEIFTNGKMDSIKKDCEPLILGGISLDNNGECITSEEIPDSVNIAIKKYMSDRKEERNHNIIHFRE